MLHSAQLDHSTTKTPQDTLQKSWLNITLRRTTIDLVLAVTPKTRTARDPRPSTVMLPYGHTFILVWPWPLTSWRHGFIALLRGPVMPI